MDQLPPLGTAISAVAPKTLPIYAPLLLSNATAIRSTKRTTSPYGPHPRQELDVYSSSNSSPNAPIFIFLYGGGLVRGDKVLPGYAEGLAHANVGYFLAEKLGCVAVLPNYRLISHGAVYPSGGEDVALAVEWCVQNLTGERELWIMGNSAGGIHMSTYLFEEKFESVRAKILGEGAKGLRLKGAVMLSVPFHFRRAVGREDVLKAYYGDDVDGHCPLGLLEKLLSERKEVLPGVGILVLNGTLDPEDEILEPKDGFVGAWRKSGQGQERFVVEMMEGQNHISPPLSLGTGIEKEEAWGYQVGTWMDMVRAR